MFIEVAISVDRNVVKRAAENIRKNNDLKIEIRCSWNVKAKVITSNIRGNWNHLKITRVSPSNVRGTHEFKELKKQPYLALHTYFG